MYLLKATSSRLNLSDDFGIGVDFSLWKVIDDEKRLQKERKKTVKGTGGRREGVRGHDERRPGRPARRRRKPFIRI